MNKPSKIEITEIFMAKAGNDWSKCFHGTIKRLVDAEGNPYVFGKIKVHDSYICASAKQQLELGEKLDEMVLLVLEMGLHSDIENSIPNGSINLN